MGRSKEQRELSRPYPCTSCGKIGTQKDTRGMCSPCMSEYRGVDTSVKDKKLRQRVREEVFEAYGGKCACCGEMWQTYLQLDHINNDGAQHRKELRGHNKGIGGTKMYYAVRREGFPAYVQLLCANCHTAKTRKEKCHHG